MKNIVDQAVLWGYCFLAVFFVPVDVTFVAVALLAVLSACANCLARPGWQKKGLVIVFLIFSVGCPKLLLFIPLMIYAVLSERNYVLAVFCGIRILCSMHYDSIKAEFICLVGMGILLACVLEYQTRRYAVLEEKYRRTRDDSAERNLLLKEKNQSILKNQDYEIYTATLKERNRIAREIHDNVGHMLSRSILMVGAMKAVHGEGMLAEPMGQLEGTLNAAMTSVRESVHDLHDESVNLQEVLRKLVSEFTFCSAELEYDMGYDVPGEIRYSFIAIVKEALHNVTRHSNATQVRIIVREHPGLYQLIVEDNGSVEADKKGLQNRRMPGDEGTGRISSYDMSGNEDVRGIGLQNMMDRIDTFGGNMEVQREKGWRIYITVPKRMKR